MATSSDITGSKETSGSLISCDFEIFGTVQGVFFRKYTQKQATKLNLVGWVKNTSSGTVKGHMEGRKDDINAMKNWLRTTGSPRSKITKADFSNEKPITQLNGKSFAVNNCDAKTNAYELRIQQKYDDGVDFTNQSVEIKPVEYIRRYTL
ncbi:unnamed protein product [Rotaria sp. Silwood1]|nr:unnamed protein product [Rotaria sp. Silwood1]CAF3329759.1 unnamed protein product [Rotaria sp. Silwood1]CAF3358034.1 unnamed protein product [Rotaria sp. Silwood1]CAF4541216.1 unnamed protein product [Rotaria sp. Silwood1]